MDLTQPEQIKEAWTAESRMVWLETPTNPMLSVFDIRAISDVVHELGGVVVVDNTFATPYLQQPLDLGADVVVHSATKYIGGHSDVVGGFVATNNESLAEDLVYIQNAVGAILARLTVIWRCVELKRSPFAWTATVKMPNKLLLC